MIKETIILSTTEFESKTKELMHDMNFLVRIAEGCNKAYWDNEKEPVIPLLTERDKAILFDTAEGVEEIEIMKAYIHLAMGTAAFNALNSAISISTDLFYEKPFDLLNSIVEGKPNMILMDMANCIAQATWLSVATTRGKMMDEDAIPYNMLSKKDQFKDEVQVKAAAKVWFNSIINS